MNPKLVEMMKAVRTALEDNSCKKEVEDLLRFAYKDLASNSPGSYLARKILREVGKSDPRTISTTISAFDPYKYGPLQRAAEIVGIKVKISVEPPF